MTGAMNRRTTAGLIFTISLFSVACKQSDESQEGRESEIASLDNFAGTEFRFNDCRKQGLTPFKPPQGRILEGHFSSDIEVALSSIPDGLRTAFFAAPINGYIAVTKAMTDACPALKNMEGVSDDTLSCIKSDDSSNSLTIYIKEEDNKADTIRNIHHATTRAFGYIMAQVIAPNVPEQSDLVLSVADELAIRLLADVADSKNPRYSLSVFNEQLPADVLIEGLSEEQRRAAWQSLDSAKKRDFKEAVLAEVFDSLYCSERSKSTLAQDFPRVWGSAYAHLDDGTGESLQDYLAIFQAEDAVKQIVDGLNDSFSGGNSDSFALWGRWGRGNGPIRQGLRNWGAHRRAGNGLFNARRFNNGGGYVFRRPWFNPRRW